MALFLVELVAVDFDGIMTFANAEHLAAWGVDADTARAAAQHNLTTGGLSVIAVDDLPGGWWIAGPDSYESSWLAVPDRLFDTAATQVEGEPLVIALARGLAVLIGDRDRAAVAAALQWGDAVYRTEARPLSPVAYRRAGDRVGGVVARGRPSGAPGGGAGAPDPRQRRVRRAEAPHRPAASAVGEDVFVASASLAGRDDGTLWTWAVWSNDVTETLLPEVDVVAFHGGDGAIVFVPWDEVLAEAGDHLTEEPGWGLTRWRASGWPPATTLARLRTHAVEP